MNLHRRKLTVCMLASGAFVPIASHAQTSTADLVKDSDPNAVALGYSTDATKTDTKRYPQYVAGRTCSGCVLFAGKPGDKQAACAVFGGKSVSAQGWCSAWAKKP